MPLTRLFFASVGVALGFYYATLYEKDPEKTNLYIEAFHKNHHHKYL